MPTFNIEEKAQRIISAYRNNKITWLEAKELLSELQMDALTALLGPQPIKGDNGKEQS